EQERKGAEQRVPWPTAVEGVRVEVAGQHHRTDLVLQCLEQGTHLRGAQRPRAMNRQVNRDRNEGPAGTLDRGDQADVPPVHALVAELLAIGARQLDHARLADRPARQDRLPEQGFMVVAVARRAWVVVAADRGLDEERRPDAVEAKGRSQLAANVAVARA